MSAKTFIISEGSSRLRKSTPEIVELWEQDVVTIAGRDLEKLMVGAWASGYGDACGEIGRAPAGEVPPLVDFILDQIQREKGNGR